MPKNKLFYPLSSIFQDSKKTMNFFLLIFSFAFALAAYVFIFQKNLWTGIFHIPDSNPGLYSDSFFIFYFISATIIAAAISIFSKKISFWDFAIRFFLVFLLGQIILIYGIDKVICAKPKAICLSLNRLLPLTTPLYFLFASFLHE